MISTGKYQTWSSIALFTCLVACLTDMISLIIFARHFPAYNPNTQPISGLGASGSPIAGIVSSFWIFLGFVFVLFAYAYNKGNYSSRLEIRITAWLIVIYALGEQVGSGLFPGNHLNQHLTTIGIIHNLIGGIGVVALMAIPFILSQRYNSKGYPVFNKFLWIISFSGIGLFALFSVSRLDSQRIQWLRSWHGLWQRLFIANYYILLISAAFKLFLENRKNK